MPKGRSFVPPTRNDGLWFHHRGLPEIGPLTRESATSTGLMLTSPYKPHTANYPPLPPQPYNDKNTKNFKNSNTFSAHDNRHSFQDHGVYFGNGHDTRSLGKNLIHSDSRHHSTSSDYLKHYGRNVVNYDYDTNYHQSYLGKPTDVPPTRRRYPKKHEDGNPALAKLDTATTSWFSEPDVPYQTPTHVLAVSQEPFLPKNTWQYSNHGRSKCYPPYDKTNARKTFSTWTVPGIPRLNHQDVLST